MNGYGLKLLYSYKNSPTPSKFKQLKYVIKVLISLMGPQYDEAVIPDNPKEKKRIENLKNCMRQFITQGCLTLILVIHDTYLQWRLE